jgi:hypothetical protein
MLPTAATARNRRRVGSCGGNIMGWSIADVFMGSVIYTRSAWVIWICVIGFALHKDDAEPAEGHLTRDTSSETIQAALEEAEVALEAKLKAKGK